MAIVKTLTFSEESKGWTSFWSYDPKYCFSLAGSFFSIKNAKLYRHYDVEANQSTFYGVYYDSSVTIVINENPSIPKNFKTINYEGTNGWQVSSIESDSFRPSSNEYGNVSSFDVAVFIPSYSEGKYIDGGVAYRAGFDRKENKYYANIKSGVVIPREGEVLSIDKTAGIKGVFATVVIETDETTDIGGVKQLFAVSSEYVQSS